MMGMESLMSNSPTPACDLGRAPRSRPSDPSFASVLAGLALALVRGLPDPLARGATVADGIGRAGIPGSDPGPLVPDAPHAVHDIGAPPRPPHRQSLPRVPGSRHAHERPCPAQRLVVAARTRPTLGCRGRSHGARCRAGLLGLRSDGGQLHRDRGGGLLPPGRGLAHPEPTGGLASVRRGGGPCAGHGLSPGHRHVLASGLPCHPLGASLAAGDPGGPGLHGLEPGLAAAHAPRGRRLVPVPRRERRVRLPGRLPQLGLVPGSGRRPGALRGETGHRAALDPRPLSRLRSPRD